MTLLFLFVGLALGVSFLCSLLEAALLSVRAAGLAERKAHGSRGAALLLEIKQTRIDDAITSILVLNTVANTLGATMAGAQAARVFGSSWVGVFSGCLTLGILVISEVIPKTLGAVYATALAPAVGRTLEALTRVMTPALFVSGFLTRLLTRGRRVGMSRGELAAVIAMASHEGTIGGQESTIFRNLLAYDSIRVQDVMTPRTVTHMMPADATVGDLLADAEAETFSRIPLYGTSRDDVSGYVLQRQVLRAAALGAAPDTPLSRFQRQTAFVPEMVSVSTALRKFVERREPIAMVTDEYGGISGLVTLEDVTETILGVEIMDESDRVADLRQFATQLRDQRLARLRQVKEETGG